MNFKFQRSPNTYDIHGLEILYDIISNTNTKHLVVCKTIISRNQISSILRLVGLKVLSVTVGSSIDRAIESLDNYNVVVFCQSEIFEYTITKDYPIQVSLTYLEKDQVVESFVRRISCPSLELKAYAYNKQLEICFMAIEKETIGVN